MAAAAVLLALVGLNRAGVRRLTPYLLLGAALWVAVLKSGVHATLAGVVLVMCIPLKGGDAGNGGQRAPLGVLEHALHPWVAYVVLPVFALASGIVGYL